jgi:small subunit ribosomal protein S3
MGQKINPISLRLVINKNWQSQWFSDNNFAGILAEDIKIRKILKSQLSQKSAVSRIVIKRTAKNLQIIIYTARPGMVIGKGGSGTDKLKESLVKVVSNPNINISIEEIKKPELDAKIVADNIASQLERRIPFRRAIKMAVENAMKAGAKGAKVAVAGRLNGAEMARREKFHLGSIPLQTLSSEISYALSTANTIKGAIGVKVWIYGGNK